MMRTTPWRRTTLHFTQIFRTELLTFTLYSLCSSGSRRPRTAAEPLILLQKSSKSQPSCPAAHDPPAGGVVGHQLDHHRLPGEDPQQARSPGDVGRDLRAPLGLQLDAEKRVGQALEDAAVDLEDVRPRLGAPLRHAPPSPLPLPGHTDRAGTGSRGRAG